jgi:NADH-quinone oxidoreductase subunit L
VQFGFVADPLAGVMLLVVTGVGTLIHVYSIGYMKDDAGFARFFSYLNLFMFAMLTLVLGDNLVLMFLGWEGVGLCSYLLIGFWWEEGKNADAGKKAFITNRIGDFGFILGALFLFMQFGTVEFSGLQAGVMQLKTLKPEQMALLSVPALLLMLGACGKSAQIPLYVWLPDAMAGPTPVSALIHAATMVTAGVYMIGRMHFVYAALPMDSMRWIVLIGAATALLAGVIAVAQTDIKKVLAYSTVSQLGFMFAGMATANFETGLFHVVTHAFFKALLFLGAGAVIVALHHEQDIRKMGGLWKDLKPLAVVFIIGSLALAGCPGLAGFYSKDAILASVYEKADFPEFGVAWLMLAATALLTAFYSTRLFIVVFLAPKREAPDAVAAAHGDDDAHAAPEAGHGHGVQKPGMLLMAPLFILAFLSVFGGVFLKAPVSHFLEGTWAPAKGAAGHLEWSIHHDHEVAEKAMAGEFGERAKQVAENSHHAHALNQTLSSFLFLIGFAAAMLIYLRWPEVPAKFVGGKLHQLVYNKFYVDELYQWTVVAGVKMGAAVLWFVVDRLVIDSLVINGAGWVTMKLGSGVARLHRGLIAAGAALTVVGAAIVLRFDLVLWVWHKLFA